MFHATFLSAPKDELLDYLAGLSDEDDEEAPALEYGLAAGGNVYESEKSGNKNGLDGDGDDGNNDYADDFD